MKQNTHLQDEPAYGAASNCYCKPNQAGGSAGEGQRADRVLPCNLPRVVDVLIRCLKRGRHIAGEGLRGRIPSGHGDGCSERCAALYARAFNRKHSVPRGEDKRARPDAAFVPRVAVDIDLHMCGSRRNQLNQLMMPVLNIMLYTTLMEMVCGPRHSS